MSKQFVVESFGGAEGSLGRERNSSGGGGSNKYLNALTHFQGLLSYCLTYISKSEAFDDRALSTLPRLL